MLRESVLPLSLTSGPANSARLLPILHGSVRRHAEEYCSPAAALAELVILTERGSLLVARTLLDVRALADNAYVLPSRHIFAPENFK